MPSPAYLIKFPPDFPSHKTAFFLFCEVERKGLLWNSTAWRRLIGEARKAWGKLTDDELEAVAGEREILLAKIQERYRITRDEANRQIDEWSEKVQR